ncbi:hypothetical protein D3C84_484960 [compost metagenome]
MKNYSNYHNSNPNDKIANDGKALFEFSLNGFEGYDVTVNGQLSRAIMTPKFNSVDETTQNIYGKIEDIVYGNIITVNETNEDWLVMTKPIDNKIYRKATVRYCNSLFPIQSEITKVLIGTDPRTGRPIYDEQIVTTNEPCIVESQYSKSSDVDQFMIPEGKLVITMKYQVSPSLSLDYEFSMYGNKYKATDFDYTNVIGDNGIMKIIAEKVV